MLIGCPVSCHKLLIASKAKQGSDPQNQKITDTVAIYGLIFSCLIIFFNLKNRKSRNIQGVYATEAFFPAQIVTHPTFSSSSSVIIRASCRFLSRSNVFISCSFFLLFCFLECFNTSTYSIKVMKTNTNEPSKK